MAQGRKPSIWLLAIAGLLAKMEKKLGFKVSRLQGFGEYVKGNISIRFGRILLNFCINQVIFHPRPLDPLAP